VRAASAENQQTQQQQQQTLNTTIARTPVLEDAATIVT
jgi:hypothetical protein